MYEISDYIRTKRQMSTVILKTPTGKYTLVGSVPIELTSPRPTMGNPDHRDTQIFETEEQAINALLQLDITKFQLSNCLWYSKAETPAP